MPKIVDYTQRRADIVAALLRLAQRDGLHAVSLRAVAAEAGLSLRLVQYYFDTKAGLMHAALTELERRSHQRWASRLGHGTDGDGHTSAAAAPDDAAAVSTAGTPAIDPATDPRSVLDAFVEEALPSDEPSRAFQRLWMSYAALAATDPDLPQQPLADGPRRLEHRLATTLRHADLPAGADPDAEAACLLKLVHGLGSGVLSGQRTVADARGVLRYHLNRVFGGAQQSRRPAGDGGSGICPDESPGAASATTPA